MALRAGVPLKDMEMMQFHPTTLSPTGVLITEGCRGEGAYLLNSEGERFLKRYAPNAMELASRDVISRAEQTEIDEGRGINGNVLLDLRHLGAEKIIERLPGRASSRWSSPASTRSTSRSRSGRARTTTWAASTPFISPFTGSCSRYLTANTPSAYFVAIPNRALIHIQKTAPGPPIMTAVATPTIFPVPIVAARAVINAWK